MGPRAVRNILRWSPLFCICAHVADMLDLFFELILGGIGLALSFNLYVPGLARLYMQMTMDSR